MKSVLVFVGVFSLLAVASSQHVSNQLDEEQATCTEGSFWFNECNSCFCVKGREACTKMGCIPGWERSFTGKCKDGSRWLQDGCNWCSCMGGAAVCTLRLCIPAPAVARGRALTETAQHAEEEQASPEAVCETKTETDRWRVGCNWCSCSEAGVPICTKRACSPAIVERLTGTKECEGSPSFKRDCNWCHCNEGGDALCTLMACPPSSREGAESESADEQSEQTEQVEAAEEEPVCQLDEGESGRWRDSCNWCRCLRGKAACTKRGCPPPLMTRLDGTDDCEGSVRWKNDCNWCNCVQGKGVCTRRGCAPHGSGAPRGAPPGPPSGPPGLLSRLPGAPPGPPGSPSPASPRSNQEQCEEGSRWTKSCNSCSCRGGHAACTLRGCITEVADTCQEGARWKTDDCNWCSCSSTGIPICTKRLCLDGASPPAPPPPRKNGECKEGSIWTDSCNSCMCAGGHVACTLRGCPTEVADTCQEGARWKTDDCNWCSCSSTGIPVCTKRLCFGRAGPPEAPRLIEGNCEEGSQWTESCNSCFCAGGTAACTLMGCITEVADTCQKGARWKTDDCNWCSCSSKGIPVCTRRLCIESRPYPQDPTIIPSSPRPMGIPRDDRDCVPGSRFTLDGCNWCTCTETGIAACTLMACIRQVNESAKVCEEGARWRQDCNWCSCANGRGLCTLMACLPDHLERAPPLDTPPAEPQQEEVAEDAQCTEGSRWRQDCNWCNCRGGRGVCTKRGCVPGFVSEEAECEAGARWKVACNWCQCSDTGLGLCTLKACVPQRGSAERNPRGRSLGGPQGFAVAQTLGGPRNFGAAQGVGSQSFERECQPGARFRQSCNWCSCSQEGRKLCTRRLCNPSANFANQPQCEGSAMFKDEQNCNWCHCYNGIAACTYMFCYGGLNAFSARGRGRSLVLAHPQQVEEREPQCTEGTSWVEECNQCHCRNGLKTCTRRLCSSQHAVSALSGTADPRRCRKPVDSGPCFASFRVFRFNTERNRCEPFLYGGCMGNDNRFETFEECQQTCGGDAPVLDSSCDRTHCPDYREHPFLAVKGCRPMYEGGSCCPTGYFCTGTRAVGSSPDSCEYHGVTYNIGQDVPVTDVCSICRCDRDAKINCISIECPSLFRPSPPGCRRLYRDNECCEYKEECSLPVPGDAPVSSKPKVTCESEGKSYLEGDKMFFDSHGCQRCICGANYTDAFGPSCQRIDCGYDFRYLDRIQRGCVPLYYKDSCCPITFICPGDSRIAGDQPQANPDGLTENVCLFDGRSVAVGHRLATTEDKITCSCQIPPEVTCVQARN